MSIFYNDFIYVITVLVLIMTISSKYVAIPFKLSFGYFAIPLSFGTPHKEEHIDLICLFLILGLVPFSMNLETLPL